MQSAVRNDIKRYELKRTVEGSVSNVEGKFKHLYDLARNKEPKENINLGGQIDYARLSQQSYLPIEKRGVEGFEIVPEFTTQDRTVYYHKNTKKAVIAFRGTDVHDWGHGAKGFFHSRGFRDVTTDIILAAGEQGRSHRFKNAENVTRQVIKKYGKQNTIATGHSLGGSQAMHVSNKFGIHAEVYNPHVDWFSATTFSNYYNTALHVNKTDPVAAFSGYSSFQSVDSRYNKKKAPFLGQHGIDNFVLPPKAKAGGKKATPGLLPAVKPKPKKIVKYTAPKTPKVAPRQQTVSADPVKPKSTNNHMYTRSHLYPQNGRAPKTKTRAVRARA